MKFSLSLSGINPRHFTEIARAAEDAGFESVWVPDHLVLPADVPDSYPYTEGQRAPIDGRTAVYDAWVSLAAIAAVTTRIKLGTNVYVLPLRHPLVTARAVLTLERMSGGRATLGAGVGWLETEFVAAGQDFRTRGARTDEIIPLLRRLWSEDVIEHRGDHYTLAPSHFEPKPVSKPTIPIEIGGASNAAFRRAGLLGDGWIAIGADDLTAYASMVDVVLGHRAASGREGPFEITATVEPTLGAAERHRELATTRLIVMPGDLTASPPPSQVIDVIGTYGRDVIAAFDKALT